MVMGLTQSLEGLDRMKGWPFPEQEKILSEGLWIGISANPGSESLEFKLGHRLCRLQTCQSPSYPSYSSVSLENPDFYKEEVEHPPWPLRVSVSLCHQWGVGLDDLQGPSVLIFWRSWDAKLLRNEENQTTLHFPPPKSAMGNPHPKREYWQECGEVDRRRFSFFY